MDWEDPLEKGKATHYSILTWRFPWAEEPAGYSSRGLKESDTTECLRTHTCLFRHKGSWVSPLPGQARPFHGEGLCGDPSSSTPNVSIKCRN